MLPALLLVFHCNNYLLAERVFRFAEGEESSNAGLCVYFHIFVGAYTSSQSRPRGGGRGR